MPPKLGAQKRRRLPCHPRSLAPSGPSPLNCSCFCLLFLQCLLDGWVHRHNGHGPGIRRVYHSLLCQQRHLRGQKFWENFVAAWILLKLGPKRTVSLSCLLICAVVVGGVFHLFFPAFILTRFLLGFGGAILMICMTPYVVYCFEPKQQPIFIGLNNAGPNTGNLIALLSVTAVRGWLGSWRSVILFYGIFSVVFLVLWLFVGRGYPIAEKAKEETLSSTVYRYRDGLREPFLYKFLFTMTGRLVVYTVMLYLFPLHPDFTVDAQFISLMIALTGIPGTILGIVLAKKLKRQITLFRFSGLPSPFSFFAMILTNSAVLATVCAICWAL